VRSNADDLALEAVKGEVDLHRFRLRPDDDGRSLVVLVGEVDLLLALLGDGHGGPDHVDLLLLQGGDDAVPCRLYELAFRLHLRADRIHQVDLEADPFAGGVLAAEGRIRLGGHAEFDGVVRMGGKAGQRHHRSQNEAPQNVLLHGFSLLFSIAATDYRAPPPAFVTVLRRGAGWQLS
jgi:hypothetical protein